MEQNSQEEQPATLESIGRLNDAQLLQMKDEVDRRKAAATPEAQQKKEMDLVAKGIGLGRTKMAQEFMRRGILVAGY